MHAEIVSALTLGAVPITPMHIQNNGGQHCPYQADQRYACCAKGVPVSGWSRQNAALCSQKAAILNFLKPGPRSMGRDLSGDHKVLPGFEGQTVSYKRGATDQTTARAEAAKMGEGR